MSWTELVLRLLADTQLYTRLLALCLLVTPMVICVALLVVSVK